MLTCCAAAMAHCPLQDDEHRTPLASQGLRHCCRSLCIIDEFGKGTLTADGVGLLCATLSAFAERPDPPRVVACTHFSEVLKHQYLPRQAGLSTALLQARALCLFRKGGFDDCCSPCCCWDRQRRR